MHDMSTPARLYAVLVGAALAIAGVVGFFYNSTFTDDEQVRDEVLGVLAVNGWHNLVHLLTGLLGLALARTAARQYALGLGLVYLVVAVWGFALGSGESILSVIPINTADNVLHLVLGLTGLAAGAAREHGATTRAAPA